MYPTIYVLRKNSKKHSTENCHFYSREKSLYIAWACFRNVLNVHHVVTKLYFKRVACKSSEEEISARNVISNNTVFV